jgi:hypothetical protein
VLPAGQPEPLTVSTSTVTLPGGGVASAEAAVAGATAMTARATAAQPAVMTRLRVASMVDMGTLLK